MNCYKYILVVIILISGSQVFAQDLLVSLSPLLDQEDLELSDSQFDRIVDASKGIMNDYYKAASLFDENLKIVSQESIDDYRNLFTDNAKIVNDLYNQLLNDRKANNYASDVLDHLMKEGVQFEMFSASIRDVTYDNAGYYKVEVQTQKTLYNGLDYDNSITRCKTGRVYFLIFTLYIEKDNLSDAKIYKIKGEIKKRCQDATGSVGVHVKAGFGATSGFNNNKASVPSNAVYENEFDAFDDFAINVDNVNVFGAGVAFTYPITKKELLYFSAQLNYELYNLKTSATGTYYFQDDNSLNQVVFLQSENLENDYYKYVSMNAEEKARFHQIELPIGVMYKKKFQKNNNLIVGINGWLVSGFNLIQNIESTVEDLKYWANIDFENENLGIDFQEETNNEALAPFGIGNVGNISNTDGEVELKASFSVRLSPFVQFALDNDKTSYLEVAAEFTHGISSLINHNSQGGLYLRNEREDLQNSEAELNESLLQNYFEKSSMNTIGLRLGFVKSF